jgi:hypothetical protein
MVATKLNYLPQFLSFISLISFGTTAPSEPELPYSQRRTTVGRTSLTTHSTHNRHTSMPLVVFEPTIPAGEGPQTDALDRAATGTGYLPHCGCKFVLI